MDKEMLFFGKIMKKIYNFNCKIKGPLSEFYNF